MALSKIKKDEFMKWLKPFNFALVSIYMAAGYVSTSIERAALNQPTAPTELYKYPHEIKGVIRYFTPLQDYIHSIAKPTMFVSAIIIADIVIFGLWLANMIKEENLLIIFMCMLLINVFIWFCFR